MLLRWAIVFFFGCGLYWGWSQCRIGSGKVCRLGWRWAVRGGPVVWALNIVFIHSEGSATGCW